MGKGYGYNSRYLIKDGRPWFPVMGEMHYSRYHDDLWEESLRKMKAGGIDVVSSYVIWIHHEEEKGIYEFTGCRNLRKFIMLCKKVGLSVILRLGPWAHGEVRNGGFPDWLMQKGEEGMKLRTNDEHYLREVRSYWEQVFNEVNGYLYKEGGPIIGVQIENEYGHVGGLQGEEGEAHMRRLTKLAKQIGFQVPLYTATGWGGACIGDLLPVMGGYCEAPWDQRTTELEANPNYVFSHVRNDSLIACDYHVEGQVTFDESQFPYLTAELGGGLQVTGHRRPVTSGADIGAMSLTKLGSGVALLGYYMYHGGSNPKGKLSTLQESKATGAPNDLPEINYDFNAPIRQYGEISDSYREIKLLAYFLHDFGEEFATLEAEIIPEHIKPEDVKSLRCSCRHDDEHGYVFFNNYQRRRKMSSHQQVEFTGTYKQESVTFPKVDLPSGAYGFFPYKMKLGEAVLTCALATPLCRLKTKEGDVYVFYGDYDPKFQWETEKKAEVLQLSREEALNAWKVSLEEDYLILSDNFVWEEEGRIQVTGGKDTMIKCFPELKQEIPGFVRCGKEKEFTVYQRKQDGKGAEAEVTCLSVEEEFTTYEINISYQEKEDRSVGRDSILQIAYSAESMELYCDGSKINDYFYTGQKAVLSLGYFGFPKKLTARLHRLHESDPIFIEKWPELQHGSACSIDEVTVVEEYR